MAGVMISFEAPIEIKEQLEEWAGQEERSVSWLLRRIVRDAIAEHEAATAPVPEVAD